MKEINCKDNQILNPVTKRCINRDTKKAIEILYKMNDKNIHKIYELVNGRIIKRCEDGKNRNPETNRCVNKVNKTKKVVKPSLIKTDVIKKSVTIIPESLRNKIEAVKKAKKALLPFINRVSADVYHRNKYLVLMKRELKNKKKGCLEVYKENPDGTRIYRIGSRIIFKKRIGTDSKNGIVFLSEFREKDKKLFTFASKIYIYQKKNKDIEIPILEKLTNLVRMDVCPHFPILYGYVLCDKRDNDNKDSFVKSRPEDKSISQKNEKKPEFVRENINQMLITTFNELANGDLWSFFRLYINNEKYLLNALVQQLLSIMFFQYHTKRIHNDAHPGNFLYHKIKSGGYFHYNINGVDYYLENIGFLWVIWDFDYSVKINEAIKIVREKRYIINDYDRICEAYTTLGYGNMIELDLLTVLKIFSDDFIIWSDDYFTINEYNKNNFNKYITYIPEKMCEIKNVFIKSLPKGEKIINSNPYMINRNNIF